MNCGQGGGRNSIAVAYGAGHAASGNLDTAEVLGEVMGSLTYTKGAQHPSNQGNNYGGGVKI